MVRITPSILNCCNALRMVHITVPNQWWLNQMNKQIAHRMVATRCYIILRRWCRPLSSILRNRLLFRILKYGWFLWHKIIIILWNKTVNGTISEFNEFPWKGTGFRVGRSVLSLQQVRNTCRACFLIYNINMTSLLPPCPLVWFEDPVTYWYETFPDLLLLPLSLTTVSLYMTFSAFSLIPLT